jgi:exosortase/archaeosortase family protein
VGFQAWFDRIGSLWAKALSVDRDLLLLVVLVLSSFVALLPFAREASVSNFLIYAILPVIVVFANRERFRTIPVPDGKGIIVALALIFGSLFFNAATGLVTEDFTFGLTDYVILVSGLFALLYSVSDSLVRFGIVALGGLRGATLILSALYTWIFAGVSSFFVGIVVFLSSALISDGIHPGAEPGQIVVGGAAGSSIVGIGWGCAGLEELVLVAVVLYVLIDSFNLGWKKSMSWLALGVIGSFAVNILRMVILIWIAFARGVEDMLWVHTHVGDVLFLLWIAVFWVLFFRLERPHRIPAREDNAVRE